MQASHARACTCKWASMHVHDSAAPVQWSRALLQCPSEQCACRNAACHDTEAPPEICSPGLRQCPSGFRFMHVSHTLLHICSSGGRPQYVCISQPPWLVWVDNLPQHRVRGAVQAARRAVGAAGSPAPRRVSARAAQQVIKRAIADRGSLEAAQRPLPVAAGPSCLLTRSLIARCPAAQRAGRTAMNAGTCAAQRHCRAVGPHAWVRRHRTRWPHAWQMSA